ncbi:dTDP-4-dehydrorhamnose reductase [Hydrogenophaga aromaticivorans]|uniref:dTDP-4-dehydrorhamnose reductase n=1 Tax=Hydrogenophaga aromaticivorans TaxID=2610898 RepID=UPI001B36B8B8|nr:dTDP-4-dehydrorhamnose reductase [Hydrogenophaga aromaticivorans]MDZ4300509.1 dTDP-4-dehydrorhamnose reductase [Pseudomonas sp.]
MNILLTGKNGQVGFELQRSLAPLGNVIAIDSGDCDLADAKSLRALIQRVQPQLIVNPAAYTAVDRAEADAAQAMAVNAIAPGVMGEEASRLGATVIHFSTDYVFDGRKSTPYVESDATEPLSAYGRSKLEGESALARATPRHLILRTSWVVGAHGNNFAKTMLRLGAEREQLSVVNDQHGAPTSAALVADVTAHLVRQLQATDAATFPYGLYHMTASGETNWCDYARFVIGYALRSGRAMRLTPNEVLPISSAQYPTAAQRPQNSRLDTSLFRSTFGLQLPPWQQGLGHILQQIL